MACTWALIIIRVHGSVRVESRPSQSLSLSLPLPLFNVLVRFWIRNFSSPLKYNGCIKFYIVSEIKSFPEHQLTIKLVVLLWLLWVLSLLPNEEISESLVCMHTHNIQRNDAHTPNPFSPFTEMPANRNNWKRKRFSQFQWASSAQRENIVCVTFYAALRNFITGWLLNKRLWHFSIEKP